MGRRYTLMESGGIFLLAIIVILALGCINSSIKARKEKNSSQDDSAAK